MSCPSGHVFFSCTRPPDFPNLNQQQREDQNKQNLSRILAGSVRPYNILGKNNREVTMYMVEFRGVTAVPVFWVLRVHAGKPSPRLRGCFCSLRSFCVKCLTNSTFACCDLFEPTQLLL